MGIKPFFFEQLPNPSKAHQNPRKREFPQVSTEPSKKIMIFGKMVVVASTADSSQITDFSDTTRNLLEEPFFSGIKTEVFEGEEEDNMGVSTELISLCSSSSSSSTKANQDPLIIQRKLTKSDQDPWKIKKKLTKSDLSNMSRLMLSSKAVKEHILPFLGAMDIDNGVKVRVWDCDTEAEHTMKFKRWGSNKAYVFIDGWVSDFVKRRGLKENHTVGLYWDLPTSRFCFSLLQNATSNLV